MITKVHQALHGYSDGHRQLVSSLSLSPQEAKLVLVMSDVSGPGVTSEGISYLTGYPLPEAGVYAIARTWPALEMARPGCVWTHTFFIDFADLACIDSPSRIANHFARPSDEGWSRYSEQEIIDFEECTAPSAMSTAEVEWLGKVLNALYSAPGERILARREPPIAVESLVLRAWDQQWPRLRRSFRFCTLTTKDRSTEGVAFDLQVVPSLESGMRTRLPGSVEAADISCSTTSEWLTGLMADIEEPNAAGLRDLLRMLGADILGGREAMPALCEFHNLTALIPNNSTTSVIDAAVAAVSEPHLLAGSRRAKTQVANLVLNHITGISDDSLLYLMEHLSLVEPARLEEKVQELGMSIWERQPQMLIALLQVEGDTQEFAKQMFRKLPVDALMSGWPHRSGSLQAVLGIRPELLETISFWSTTQSSPSVIAANGHDLSSETIVVAMLQGLRDEDAIVTGVQTVGALATLNGLQHLLKNNTTVSAMPQWIKHSCSANSVVASFLGQVRRPAEHLLELIAEELAPDAVPNDYGQDPWLNALLELRESRGSLPAGLCAYGFRRALGWSSRSIAELMQLTFEQLHEAVASSVVEESSWVLIEDRLPWVPVNRSWDRCLRLRQAVADAFIGRRLSPKSFAWIAVNNSVYWALMEEALDHWGGHRFLQEVEHSLRSERDPATIARRTLIHEFLETHRRLW